MQPNYQLIAYEMNVHEYTNTPQIYNNILEMKQQFLQGKTFTENLTSYLVAVKNELYYAQNDMEIQRQIIEKFELYCQLADKKIQEQEQRISTSYSGYEGYKELLQLRIENTDLKNTVEYLYRQVKATLTPQRLATSPGDFYGQKSDHINYKITIKQYLKQIQELERFKERLLQKLEFDVDEDCDVVVRHVEYLKNQRGGDVDKIVGRAELLVDENEALRLEAARLYKYLQQAKNDNYQLKELLNSGLAQIGKEEGEELRLYLEEKERVIKQLQLQINRNPGSNKQYQLYLKVLKDRVLDLIDDMRIDKKADLLLLKQQVSEIEI